jgi:hypothetical protein
MSREDFCRKMAQQAQEGELDFSFCAVCAFLRQDLRVASF